MLYLTLITETLMKQTRLKKDSCKCVMRNNALFAGQTLSFFLSFFFFNNNNENVNLISIVNKTSNFKFLSLLLLYLYDSHVHHRMYRANFENF